MSTALELLLKGEKLPAAVLLVHGTREDAFALIKKLIPSSKIGSGNHPDLHQYIPEEKSGLHSMGSMQKLIQEVSLPPFEARVKVFLIEKAEKMLPSASNALLKTLEEPPEDTFFFLLSDRPKELLATIRSRLYPILFPEKEGEGIDLGPLFASAAKGQWDEVLDGLNALEGEDPDALFLGCLSWARGTNDPKIFEQMVRAVEGGQKALLHNVKIRSVFFSLIESFTP